MEEFKGTHGPWHYQKDADVYTHIVRPDSHPGRIILYGSQSSTEENKANLVLAASAPDLLSSLQYLVHLHMCEQEGLSSGQPTAIQWLTAVDNASEAISKALGRV